MRQSEKGLLLIVSGPAGVGKGTVNAELIKRHPEIRMSVSATTRKPRPCEIDGVHYFFKTQAEFEQMISENAFLEYMHVFGMNYYGTPKQFVVNELNQGHHVILEIDVQGARKVKEAFPEAIRIFIAPPSMAALKERLVKRGTETPEAIETRTKTAFAEMRAMPECDYLVINDDLNEAIAQMEAIVAAEMCSVAHNETVINTFLGGIEEC